MTTSDVFARRLAARLGQAVTSDDDLDDRFLTRAGVGAPRPAAVLVGLFDAPGGARVLLTRRSTALRHHPGQIAFPGGKVDEGESGPRETALREAHEEVGLDPAAVEIVAELAPHETVTGFTVIPVLARIEAPGSWHPELGEVEEVFTVPLSHVLELANYSIQSRDWRGSERRYYTVPWGPYYIWGATARILRQLAEAAQ